MIRNIISMARANPRWAVTALSLDATIGAILAITVYFALAMAKVNVGVTVALVACGILAIVGVVCLGYGLLLKRAAEDAADEYPWG